MDHAEQVVAATTQSKRILCPQCSQDRKKNNPTLSVTVEAGKTLYQCHHCNWSGMVTPEPMKNYTALLPPKPVPQIINIPTQKTQDQQQIIDFFSRRGVTISDLSVLPPMMTSTKYFHGLGSVDAIGFIYGDVHQPSAIKWRAVHRKAFTQDNAASTFYGMAHLKKDDETVIIVEGEADVIALASIGIRAISCPNGAPMKVSNRRISAEEDGKFAYVWEARALLDQATKIILAVDADEAGAALAEELARRIGRAKCWQPKYPENCKDVNDVLAAHGAEAVTLMLNQSEAMPLAGVYGVAEYQDELQEFYKNGHGRGESTGLKAIDDLFTIKEGCMSIVTGLPSSGKSEFVDQLMVNLALSKSWKFAVASFENPPAIHIAKLAEKIVGKPFYEGALPRMRPDELRSATDFINDHFVFLESKEGSPATIDSILDRCKQAVMRLGVRGLVIDPYNYLEQASNVEEYQSISRILTQVTTFAKAYGLHVWFVAHPAKMQMREDGTYPVPQGMHISGSAAWFAKADLGVTVHRGKQGVEIHCWKSRFKWMGQQGMCLLGYDVPTGRYFDGHREVGEIIPNKTKAAVASHWQDL